MKVDREERPDVDALYMEAVQSMTGSGGWPLNVFLTPEQLPFYGGTYFPPEPRHGMPAWTRRAAGDRRGLAREPRRRSAQGASGCASTCGRSAACSPSGEARRPRRSSSARSRCCARASTPATAASAARPKFPQASVLEFLLLRRASARCRSRRCARWPSGGIHDQLGGGFPRYSVDATWTVPALREDALRQRPARARLPARLAGDRRGAPARGLRGHARVGAARDAGPRGSASTAPWTPTPRASRAASTCGACRSCARVLGDDARQRDRLAGGRASEGNFVDPHHPAAGPERAAGPRPAAAARGRGSASARALAGPAGSASARRSTTSA